MIEKPLTGRQLYQATASMNLTDPDLPADSWDSLPWTSQDAWQAQADEINEARREPQDA